MKAGKSSATVMVLSSESMKTRAALKGLVLGGDAAHQFDQLHHRHGIHEMDADEALGPIGREARRVIESDEVLVASMASGIQDRADLLIDLALDGFILGGGLDDQIHGGQAFDLRGASAMRASAALAVGFGGFPGGDLTRKVAADGGEHGLQAIFGHIVNVNIIARHRADMSDPAAHLARAYNANTLDLVAHGFRLTDFRGINRRPDVEQHPVCGH
jgi:hypothetical protein